LVAPSKKSTLPVGTPTLGATGLTVAVNVTDWLVTDGFALEMTVVVVEPWLTVMLTGVELVGAKFASPEYVANTLCVPIGNVLLMIVAAPPLSVAVPSAVPPLYSVTYPVGVPEPEVTVML
jgi:hypothetical protein